MESILHLVRRPAPASAAAEPRLLPSPPKAQQPQTTTEDGAAITTPPTEPARRLTPNLNRPGQITLMTLPPELHLLIAQCLTYPDALSLKHASRHFYQLVDTGVRLKVEWLMERRLLHLECPSDRRCDLGSDLRFCRGSVRLLMQRRREHIECESRPGLGCLIYGTSTCPHARKIRTRVKKWMRMHSADQTRWVVFLVSLVPLLVGWLWMLGVMTREVLTRIVRPV
ncbi:hypothetical protein N658DRAFT_498184 [Parathielavia hyrcaniae]|uniref:F-box domain-containing protein n=1 Tax=Parathielavia hyrcaniae TaxID=113614 RepID=A0AAN6SZN6_9PEZI|nr:hypothetical protein N658DRAFT_498184 [Parathielavia hyrcaniae]